MCIQNQHLYLLILHDLWPLHLTRFNSSAFIQFLQFNYLLKLVLKLAKFNAWKGLIVNINRANRFCNFVSISLNFCFRQSIDGRQNQQCQNHKCHTSKKHIICRTISASAHSQLLHPLTINPVITKLLIPTTPKSRQISFH